MNEPTFAEWTARLKVFVDYIGALAEYKLRTAEARIKQLQGDDIQATLRLRELLIAQLQKDLRAFDRDKGRIAREIALIGKKEKSARRLLLGKKIDSSSYSSGWAAYVWFETRALMESGTALYKIKVPAAARSMGNFIAISPRHSAEAAPKEVDNALKLMDWMNDRRFVADRGSGAQQVVVALFQAIDKVAGETRQELEKRIEQLKKNTLDPWKLPELLSNLSPSAQNIQRAGSK
jgi:hypothetical protein